LKLGVKRTRLAAGGELPGAACRWSAVCGVLHVLLMRPCLQKAEGTAAALLALSHVRMYAHVSHRCRCRCRCRRPCSSTYRGPCSHDTRRWFYRETRGMIAQCIITGKVQAFFIVHLSRSIHNTLMTRPVGCYQGALIMTRPVGCYQGAFCVRMPALIRPLPTMALALTPTPTPPTPVSPTSPKRLDLAPAGHGSGSQIKIGTERHQPHLLPAVSVAALQPRAARHETRRTTGCCRTSRLFSSQPTALRCTRPTTRGPHVGWSIFRFLSICFLFKFLINSKLKLNLKNS
jgi:hypothetical protein